MMFMRVPMTLMSILMIQSPVGSLGVVGGLGLGVFGCVGAIGVP